MDNQRNFHRNGAWSILWRLGIVWKLSEVFNSWLRQYRQSVEKYLKTISKEYLIYDDNLDLLKGINEKLVFKESQLKQIEEIIVSPGIKPDHKLLNEFPEKKVFTDIDLFSSKFEGVFIGVTGTNGKTTFVNLLSNFLNENGIESIACGNVGISPLEFESNQKNYAVVELSSFQLFYSKNLKIDFGVFLNFHSDHLDWHGNIEAYKNSKIKLLSFLETNENLIVGKNTISSLKHKIFYEFHQKKK